MNKLPVKTIAIAVESAIKKGLSPRQCYWILKNEGYTDAELSQVFLKVAAEI